MLVEAGGSGLRVLLEDCGYKVISAQSSNAAQAMFHSYLPDLVILDPDFLGESAWQLLKEMRGDAVTPVIVVASAADEHSKVSALDMGANDYITKPYGSLELPARVRAVLRTNRYSSPNGKLPGGKFELGNMVIDYDSRQVFIGENEVALTQTEYNILAFLTEHSGKVMSYAAITKAVWGYSYSGGVKKLQVNVTNIRKKLGVLPQDKTYLINTAGVGYSVPNPK